MTMPSLPMTRRQWLQSALPAVAGLTALGRSGAEEEKLPPVRTITRGPRHHWFGYYDKLEFDPTGRYVLGMEVDFEHRSPKATDVVRIGMVDLEKDDQWMELGTSSAWSWQQGCMLQWIPGTTSRVIWNDRDKDRYVSRILDVKTKEKITIPYAIYALSPDGKKAIATDFRRLNDMRPGYGYAGFDDPNKDVSAPKDTGIFRIDLESGKSDLILSVADVVKVGSLPDEAKEAKHWFNHLLFNTDGSRFVFLNRFRGKGQKTGHRTRMITASSEGKDPHVVDASGFMSHFIWRDPEHILGWTRPLGQAAGFYLFKDRTEKAEHIGKDVMTQDGHCTYLPGNKWILNDTYPDKERQQHPYLFQIASNKKVALGHFSSPKEYAGEWRCDTHPRFSPDGKKVVIDAPSGKEGRQLHLIDIAKIVG